MQLVSTKTRTRRQLNPITGIMGNMFAQCFQCVEGFISTRSPLVPQACSRSETGAKGGVLLRDCANVEEHLRTIRSVVESADKLFGAEGLRRLGLEYRIVYCDEHNRAAPCVPNEENCDGDDQILCDSVEDVLVRDIAANGPQDSNDETLDGAVAFVALATSKARVSNGFAQLNDSNRSNDGSVQSFNLFDSHYAEVGTTDSLVARQLESLDDCCNTVVTRTAVPANAPDGCPMFCHLCTRRLYHVESNTMVNNENRKEFIADGSMYEVISRLVQEAAQEVMMEEGNLEWVTIEEARDHKSEPIRLLMSSTHPLLTKKRDGAGTVLICTGRGKVRAGIFSRQHLICSGLEMATAVPLVRDAVTRNLNVAIVDPNVHGEASGFVTFQRTMDFLEAGGYDESQVDSSGHMYIVSHSASGGHMVRYFLEKSDGCAFLRSIRAIAFTDSTHNIQWAKANDKTHLFDKLQDSQCVYFRCARARDGIAGDGNKWYLHPAGELVSTDSFWRHRFGTIRTMWAGTNEHSLTNWFAHNKIWEHFDFFLYGKKFRRHDVGSSTHDAIGE
jgi:hypothetical protein